MNYKMIVLELIQDQPELHEQLRRRRQVLATVETYAVALKASHEAWTRQLQQARPGSDPRLTASEAMELAIEEIRSRLHSASSTDEAEPLSLDAAMRFIRPGSPTA